MVFRRLYSGIIYIVDITFRAAERADTSISVALISISGQHPSSDVSRVIKADGIMSPVRGSAIRFVSMKCRGKLPK